MGVTRVDKDFEALTLTLVADFEASTDRVWELWADPRRLEQWWGPPTHPARMVDHDLTPGGRVFYYMTGPDGEKFHGLWQFIAVDPPKSLEFVDSFANSDGDIDDALPPYTAHLELTEHGGGTRMELRASFDTREQMDQLLGIQMDVGMQQAMSQIDALLAG
ncbi:SRPBCC domain-containing protein [Kribbella sp. NPDC051586]|uniref:SRPBCC domain-containing protein n=1 Tax=Kribbella sp. NPDC051586 TaxID=3364118 RepID=UPI00379A2244